MKCKFHVGQKVVAVLSTSDSKIVEGKIYTISAVGPAGSFKPVPTGYFSSDPNEIVVRVEGMKFPVFFDGDFYVGLKPFLFKPLTDTRSRIQAQVEKLKSDTLSPRKVEEA